MALLQNSMINDKKKLLGQSNDSQLGMILFTTNINDSGNTSGSNTFGSNLK